MKNITPQLRNTHEQFVPIVALLKKLPFFSKHSQTMFGIISSTTLLVDGQYNSNTGLKRQSSAFFWPNHAKLWAIRTQKSCDLLQIHSNFSQFNSNLNSTTFLPNIIFSLFFFSNLPSTVSCLSSVSWSQPGGAIFCQKPTGCGLLLFPYENITFSIETLDIPLNYSNSHHKHKEMWLCDSPMQSLEKTSTIHWILNGIHLILIWYFAMFHVLFPQLKINSQLRKTMGIKKIPYIHLFPYTACSFTWVPGKEQKSRDLLMINVWI